MEVERVVHGPIAVQDGVCDWLSGEGGLALKS